MIKLDYSWDALSRPYKATDYFTLADPTPLLIGSNEFNYSNAWCLAEISRLIYRNDFHRNDDINLGGFKYDDVHIINNEETSTYVVIFKLNGTDEQGLSKPCIVIAFRGTDDINDWNSNTQAYQVPFGNNGNIHAGFSAVYSSIKKQLFDYVDDLALPIFITGHSLGAALATITTSEIANNKNLDSCYTFGSPRVGDKEFINHLPEDKLYRVINNSDVVTTVPVSFATIEYQHVGSTCLFNNKGECTEGLSEEDILAYQKDTIHDLKDYALQEIFSRNIKNIKNKLPPFLADHAPLNYVLLLENTLKTI